MSIQEQITGRINGIVMFQMQSRGMERSFAASDSLMHDLCFDSLDMIEMLMATEDEFGIEINDDDAEKIGTVQQAVDYVLTRIK